MRPDRFSLAKAWINDERSTPEEAKATWEAMGKEFDENRKIFLASAESDAVKNMINKKYGPGTMKYGSEISQPPQRPEVIELDAINAWMKRNPAAEGGRQGFNNGLGVKKFVPGSGPGTGSALEAKETLKKVKVALNKIKKQRNNKNLFEWSENSDWYKKLQQNLGGMGEKGLNREYTNKLINQAVEEFFPGSYHGKNAIKNFRNDMVVKSFVQHLKSVGEFDGQEKFDKVLEQFTKGKDADHLYENINRSWKSWIAGEFEVDGVDRAQLKKELKARGINYNQITNWSASSAQGRGTAKIKEIKWLDNQNSKFPNRNPEQVKALFKKQFPNGNFELRVNELTQLKNTGVYVSGNNSEKGITGISKGDRAGWLKQVYGKQFAGNYSKIINAADKLNDPNFEGGKFYSPEKAKRLYNAADKFFGPNGIVRKSAIGEAEHALARSFDFLNPDRQLAINSIVDGDLNQFKKNLFDIPVKQYVDEYNKEGTTNARKKELKNLIENRKKTMNALTGGQKDGIVAGDIVSFQYGDKIKPTSSVKAIDVLFDKGEFDIDEYIAKGNAYGEALKNTGVKIDKFTSPIGENDFNKMIKLVGCPVKGKAEGGRIGFDNGGDVDCFDEGVKKMNNGMKGASPASMRNAAKFLNSAYKTGRNIMKFGIVPEAIFVTGETLLRSLGDQTLEEGLKSSIGFYTDWTGLTDLKSDARISQNMRNMGVDATMNIERLVDFNNATEKVNKLKKAKEFDLSVNDESLTGLTDQEVAANADKNIKAAQINLDNKFLKESEKLYFSQQQDEAADIAGSRSPFQKAYAAAKNKTENLRSDGSIIDLNELSGMQSDMFMIDPMSAQAKKARVQDLPPQSPLTGSKGETAFLNLSQLPMGPRMGSEIDVLAKAMNENFKLQGSDQRTDAAYLKAMQDYKNNYKNMTMEEMLAIGIPREAIYGFNMAQPVETEGPGYYSNYKPLNRFGSQERPVLYPEGRGKLSEGGITALRSKYEYKK